MGKIKSFLIGGILGATAGLYLFSETGQKTVKKLGGNVTKAASDAVDNVKKNSKVASSVSKFFGSDLNTFKSSNNEKSIRDTASYVASNVASNSASCSEKVAEFIDFDPKKKVDFRTFIDKTDITAGKTDAEKRNKKIVINDRNVIDKINKKRADIVDLIIESAKKQN